MNEKARTFGCVFGIIRLVILTPIWFYIWWSVLKMISAPEMLFYLFWTYVPISFILSLVEVVVKELLEDK